MAKHTTTTRRRSHAAEDKPIAARIGARLRRARTQANLTQAQLAEGRYTKAYVSALENGLVKPSMAALHFFASKLHVPVDHLLSERESVWTRLEADLRLAAGDWQQAVDAYQALLDENPPARGRAELLLGLAEGLGRLGQGQEAVRAASEAAELLESQGRPALAAWASYWEAFGLYELEQGDQAASLLDRLLDRVSAGLAVEPDLPVRALIALSAIAQRDDQPERALGFLEQARSRVGELDDTKRARFLFSLAGTYRELGDFEAAIATGMQSLAAFKIAEAHFDAASLENELALVYLALGSLDQARGHVARARAYFERTDDRRWLAHAIETEGQIALAAGDRQAAEALAGQATALAESSGNQKALVSARLLVARCRRADGDLAGAAATLEQAAATAEALGRRAQLQGVLAEWSEVLADLGDHKQAYALSRRALEAGRR